MPHIYCALCQARLGSDRRKNQQLNDANMIEKIQKIKSVFINNLKKKDNGTLDIIEHLYTYNFAK